MDEPTQDQRPEFAVRPGDEIWLNGLPRAKENVKHDLPSNSAFATYTAAAPHWMASARSGRCCPIAPRML